MTVHADEQILRVERGHAESDELAAITAVLLARAAAQAVPAPAAEVRSKARWNRLERCRAFCAPHSWQG
ncbi:acyl-CoA carboxylase subunit epsilon [Streptomyces sp. NPDC055287]